MNFSIDVCRKSLEQGFYPDIIASDWTGDKYNMSNTAKNLPFVMTKYLELGMPLKEVLRCVTETPAKVMNMEGKIGTLKPGAFADVAIFKMIDKKAIHKAVSYTHLFTMMLPSLSQMSLHAKRPVIRSSRDSIISFPSVKAVTSIPGISSLPSAPVSYTHL